MKYPAIKGRHHTKRHESISAKNLRGILDHISRGGPYDLRQTRDYAIVLTLIATGARNKELRLANREDGAAHIRKKIGAEDTGLVEGATT